MFLNIKLVVDSAEIEMNEFVKNILGNTISGVLSSLRDVNKGWKEIEIRLTK